MDDYISKPIQPEILIAALGHCQPLTDVEWYASSFSQTLTQAVDTGAACEQEAGDMTETESELRESAVLATIETLTEGDPEFKLQIIDVFLEDAPELLNKMQNGAKKGEASDLRLAAHTLKSNCADFGAEALRDLCKEAESMGKQGELGGADELVSNVMAEYEKLETVLKTLRKELTN